MNPVQHGEVFVTTDGAETDLDLGHYGRFSMPHDAQQQHCNRQYYADYSSRTRGDYLGGTVQVIPHITGEIGVVKLVTKALMC